MQLEILLVADYANVSRNGKLNVMGIFRDINAPRFPVKHPLMHLIVKLRADLGETDVSRVLTVMLMDEDAKEMMKLSNNFKFPRQVRGRQSEFNAILRFTDLVFPSPGVYVFVVLVDNDHKGELPIYVNQIEVKQLRPPEDFEPE